MIKGCQTHFGSKIGHDVLVELRGKGCRACRIDAQGLDPYSMLDLVEEVRAALLLPYVTVSRYEQIEALPHYAMVEWRNEPDIATNVKVPPPQYKAEIHEAARIAGRHPVGAIGGYVVSNLNKRGVDYINAVGPLPANTFGVCHRYGDGTYDNPHYLNWWGWLGIGPFQSREAELMWFKSKVGPNMVVSEWGYPSTDGISESQQAALARREWALHQEMGVALSFIYQLNDGVGAGYLNNFGLRRHDGTWKPVSETF